MEEALLPFEGERQNFGQAFACHVGSVHEFLQYRLLLASDGFMQRPIVVHWSTSAQQALKRADSLQGIFGETVPSGR